MIFIGIDYSYTSPAICILGDNFEASQFYYATYHEKLAEGYKNCHGHLLNSALEGVERYREIARWGAGIVALYQRLTDFGEMMVGMEGYSFGSSKSLTFNIAENAAILKLYLLDLGITPKIIAPTSAKKFFSGSGRANKEDMRNALVEKEGVDIVDWLGLKTLKSPAHDIVDSYAIALTTKGTAKG